MNEILGSARTVLSELCRVIEINDCLLFTDISLTMSVVICFPLTSASQIIGDKAIALCYDVKLYMPTKIDKTWGEPILTDLKVLAARSGRNTVESTESLDYSDPTVEIVFFPCMGE